MNRKKSEKKNSELINEIQTVTLDPNQQ